MRLDRPWRAEGDGSRRRSSAVAGTPPKPETYLKISGSYGICPHRARCLSLGTNALQFRIVWNLEWPPSIPLKPATSISVLRDTRNSQSTAAGHGGCSEQLLVGHHLQAPVQPHMDLTSLPCGSGHHLLGVCLPRTNELVLEGAEAVGRTPCRAPRAIRVACSTRRNTPNSYVPACVGTRPTATSYDARVYLFAPALALCPPLP